MLLFFENFNTMSLNELYGFPSHDIPVKSYVFYDRDDIKNNNNIVDDESNETCNTGSCTNKSSTYVYVDVEHSDDETDVSYVLSDSDEEKSTLTVVERNGVKNIRSIDVNNDDANHEPKKSNKSSKSKNDNVDHRDITNFIKKVKSLYNTSFESKAEKKTLDIINDSLRILKQKNKLFLHLDLSDMIMTGVEIDALMDVLAKMSETTLNEIKALSIANDNNVEENDAYPSYDFIGIVPYFRNLNRLDLSGLDLDFHVPLLADYLIDAIFLTTLIMIKSLNVSYLLEELESRLSNQRVGFQLPWINLDLTHARLQTNKNTDLVRCFKYMKKLMVLKLGNTRIHWPCYLQSLHELNSLKILDLSYNEHQPRRLLSYSHKLRVPRKIKKLEMISVIGRHVSDKVELLRYVSYFASLEYLDLSKNPFDDDAKSQMKNTLGRLKNLKVLKMNDCQLTHGDLESLQYIIDKNEELTHLEIKDNDFIESETSGSSKAARSKTKTHAKHYQNVDNLIKKWQDMNITIVRD